MEGLGENNIDFGFHVEHYDEPDRSQGRKAPARGIYKSRVRQRSAFMWFNNATRFKHPDEQNVYQSALMTL